MLETTILVVEDEALVAEDIRRTLQNLGYAVPSTASSGEEAIKKVNEYRPDLVLMDIVLQGEMDGIETARQISSRFNTPVIYLTAYSYKTTLGRAKITEPFGYLIKPFREEELKMAVEIALFKHETEEVLRASENKYRTLLENIPQKIFHKDKNLRYVSCNYNFACDLNIKPEEIVGKVDYDFFSKDMAEKYRADDKRIMESGKTENIEEYYILNGQQGIVHTVKTPIRDENGNITGVLGIFWDITEYKRAEEALRVSEEKYRSLIENIQDGVFIIEDARIQFANEAFARMAGYTVEEITGKDFQELVAPEDLEMVTDRYHRRQAGDDVPKEYEFRMLHNDGKRIVINMNVGLINYNGRTASMGTVKGITERKKAEEALRESEDRYRRLVDFSPFGIAIHSDSKIVYVNLAAMKILGSINPEELVGRPLLQIIHPDYHEIVKERVRKQYQGEIAPLREEKFLRLDGTSVDVEVVSIPITYKGKQAMYGIFQEITERKQAEEALLRSNEFSRNILDSMNDALCIIDAHDFKITGFNIVFLNEIGKRGEDVIGRPCYDVTHHRSSPCEPPDDTCPLLETVKTGKHSVVEHLHYGAGGKKMYLEISTSPITDENGRIIQVVHVSRDITERKLAEERLKQANIGLKKADELKTQFLSVVSHELRSPITPMNAQLQMILAGYFGDITEKQRKSLEMIQRNTTRLDRLIGDVLDISKLEAGVMKFNTAQSNLNEIVENAVETMKGQAWGKSLKLTLKEDKIPEITIDRDRITQVIINLINNAIKFTDAGGLIEVELIGNADHAIVKVKDNGIGIKKEDQEQLFIPFKQVDSSYTRKYEGSGLGLAICKRIVTHHGGKIWIESEPGKGSAFQFIIPYNYKIKDEKSESDVLEKSIDRKRT
ncbi:MAG: PAS domain S-box protein [Candidatus Methanoperedens sp.]